MANNLFGLASLCTAVNLGGFHTKRTVGLMLSLLVVGNAFPEPEVKKSTTSGIEPLFIYLSIPVYPFEEVPVGEQRFLKFSLSHFSCSLLTLRHSSPNH